MGMGDKNFTLNSGSYLIMQVLIVAWIIIKVFLHKISVKFAEYSVFRKLGMWIGPYD
jgi:hypothetical protein